MLPLQSRSFWFAVAGIAYLCVATLQGAVSYAAWGAEKWVGGVGGVLAALLTLPLLLYVTWRHTGAAGKVDDRVEPVIFSAMRAVVAAASFWIAARIGPYGRPGFDAVANAACGAASVAACFALARIPAVGGLTKPHRHTRSIDAAAFCGLLWSIATGLPATRVIFAEEGVLLDPLAIDYATTTASLGTLMVLIAGCWRLRVQRRLELGVSDRINGALALSLSAFAIGVPAVALDIAAPDRILPVAVLGASIGCVFATVVRDPVSVTVALRGIIAVMMLATPTVLLTAMFVKQLPHPEYAALIGGVLCVVVGLVASVAARPLGPEQSRWLRAIEDASRSVLQPEPDAALTATLVALNRALISPESRAELWRNAPSQVLSVDVAGYLHVRDALAPDALYPLALQEPERTLRREVLEGLQVRRPDTRSLLAWYEAHDTQSATVIMDDDGANGLLLMPRGGRETPLVLEEARALRQLADRITSLITVSSALERARKRVLEAEEVSAVLRQQRDQLRQVSEGEGSRNRALAERHARRLRSSAYSATARDGLEQLARLSKHDAPIALLAPPGVDAAAWAAHGHLSSARAGRPLLFVDAAEPRHADPQFWRSAESPISLAAGGTVVLTAAETLPHAVQDTIVELCAEQARISSNMATVAVLILREPLAQLRLERGLSTVMLSWLTAEVVLPTLMNRAEDLRSLVLEVLTRTARRFEGQPLGVDPAAFRSLLDHTWPGNDLELTDVVTRAAACSTGPLVTLADLNAIGFAERGLDFPQSPLPPPTIQRRRRRTPRRQ